MRAFAPQVFFLTRRVAVKGFAENAFAVSAQAVNKCLRAVQR
jgi:hypothetical protein